MGTLMRLGWGQENPAFRQLSHRNSFRTPKEQADWFGEFGADLDFPGRRGPPSYGD